MNTGLDIGYSRTKLVTAASRCDFASVTGTPDRSHFSLNGASRGIMLTYPRRVLIGDQAVIQSRHTNRREDRGWIESPEYLDLFLAALSEVTTATHCDLAIVTGLPVAYYEGDRETLRNVMLGPHQLARDGPDRRAQTFTVTECRVIPQGFGALLSQVLDDRGNITDASLATGHIGVIDIGGKTTNLLSIRDLADVSKETDSVASGAWDVVMAIRRWLADHCPDLSLEDHEIVQAVTKHQVLYFGESVSLRGQVEEAVSPLADQIVAVATQLWNGAAGLQAIIITGGGAKLLGDRLCKQWKHARIIATDPVYANALGYWKLGQRGR